ncbi:MAG: multiple sugar transport system substrate-binding protein, partial [Patescibacteria group bacterium]|nr:multiple sugar transport system substrate-binding protein [Patescibacteria group bacterium]
MFNQNINVFKIVTIAISVIIGIVAILIFSGKFPGVGYSTTTNKNNVTIEMWGSISKEAVDKAIMATTQATGKPVQINYTQVNKADLTNRLTQADAAGRAPDLILSDSDVMDMTSGLFYVIPYTYMSELDYNNMYIDASHIYTYPAGALMYPVLADPLVMYYNKKTFRENGLTSTPSNWTELPKYQSVLTSRDADSIPVKSAFGLGANNVTNQKDILVANLMQTGHSVAKINSFYDSNSNLTNNYYIDLGVNSNFDNENMQGDL